MNRLLLLFFLSLSVSCYAQIDSTTITIGKIDDNILSTITNLENIQLITLSNKDTTLYGNRFFLFIQEYKDGILKKEDSLDLTCIEKKVPFVIGKDTSYYSINTCDRITFKKPSKIFKIIIAGKIKEDTMHLLIKYPSIIFKRKLKADNTYLFREFKLNGQARIPLNKKSPILLYTPPYKISKGINYYCILDNKPIKTIYDKYKIQHFYVFLLAIK